MPIRKLKRKYLFRSTANPELQVSKLPKQIIISTVQSGDVFLGLSKYTISIKMIFKKTNILDARNKVLTSREIEQSRQILSKEEC